MLGRAGIVDEENKQGNPFIVQSIETIRQYSQLLPT